MDKPKCPLCGKEGKFNTITEQWVCYNHPCNIIIDSRKYYKFLEDDGKEIMKDVNIYKKELIDVTEEVSNLSLQLEYAEDEVCHITNKLLDATIKKSFIEGQINILERKW